MLFSIEGLKNLDIEKLNHFSLVFKEHSIKKASEKYNINARILRHSLDTIEKKLSIKLYHASKKSFLPTEEAVHLFNFCNDFINLLNRYNDQFFNKGIIKDNKREIIIVTTTTLAHYFLPKIVTHFLLNKPNVSIKLYAGPEYIQNRNFAFDILLAGNLDSEYLIKRKLGSFYYQFYGNTAMKEHLSDIQDPKDLKNQNLLLFAGDHLIDSHIILNNNAKIISNSYPFLLEMCNNGVGIVSCFNFKKLSVLYENSDMMPIISNYYSEIEDTFFYFNSHSDKLDLIEELYSLSFESCKRDIEMN